MRLSVEITEEQHARLRACAALQGQSIEDYALDRTLPSGEEKALKELEDLLRRRVDAVERGETYDQTVEEIFDEAVEEFKKQGAG